MQIANLQIPNPYILAPMAGYTDIAFRRLMTENGAVFAVTEMISAKALVFDSKKTKEMLETADSEKIKAVQLFGSDPQDFIRVIKSGEISHFDILDLNFGCPVGKIIRNGEGSALLKDTPRLLKIVEACADNFGVVTAKVRAGFDDNSLLPPSFYKDLQKAGASMITVHGRTAEQMYRGLANWDYVKRAKDAVTIPIAGSGDVLTTEDAHSRLKICDLVMIGRGAIYDPTLFAALNGNTACKYSLISKHIDYMYQYFGDRYTSSNIRKFWGYYLKGEANTHKLKVDLMQAQTTVEVKKLFLDFFAQRCGG